ncbi:MAG TPA: HAD family hydrolase [Candidatus Limnocylindrales bacterium]|nr:HAD family hydrolase [Candidatus Limnocylindrales bacterium]
MTGADDRRAGPGARDAPGGRLDPLEGIDLVIFDKDGTLIDFDAMWGPWVVELVGRLESLTGRRLAAGFLEDLGYDSTAGRTIAGGPLAATPMARLYELTAELLIDAGVEEGPARAALARAWEPPDPVALARPVTELRPLFVALRAAGRRLAVATTDDRRPTERALAALGVADLVDALACADDGLPVKPSPEMVWTVCQALGVEPARAAIVGDSPADLAMGRAAGVGLVVGVLSGVGSRADLEPYADLVLASVAELAPG